MRSLNFKNFSKVGLFAALSASAAMANAQSTTSTFDVTATVQSTCVLSTVGNMAFGVYVQGAGDKDGASTFDLNCGNGISYNIGISNLPVSGNRLAANGANNLQYQLYTTAARTVPDIWGSTIGTNTVAGTGTGSAQTLTIYGRIPDNAPNQAIPAGSYSQTLTITVSY
jgi:spore coat protein U-like protein